MPHRVPRHTGDDARFIADLCDWLTVAGATRYDKTVTQLEHGLQSAELARAHRGGEALIVSALLHDVGHLLADEHDGHDDFLDQDLEHEGIGAKWLARFFPPDVTEPIRLHVAAKRYLCTVNTAYYSGLSDSSKRSFEVQGGRMTAAEREAFAAEPYADAALAVRRFDDLAKVEGAPTPPLSAFAPMLRGHLRRAA